MSFCAATQDVESFYHTAYYGSASVYNMPGNESLQLLEVINCNASDTV